MKLFFSELEEISERDDQSSNLLRKRLIGGVVVIIAFFSLILLRLWSLQIHNGEEFAKKAYTNRVRIQEVAAPRGHILDRYGREIVTNRPSFNVVLLKEDSDDLDDVIKRLAPILNEEITTLWKRIREASGNPRYMPITLKKDIDWETLAYLENHNQKFSGIRIEVKPVRVYKYKDLAANTIGYLGKISKKELSKADPDHYSGLDIIGKQGLEKIYEQELRGEKGKRYSEVDVNGFEKRQLKSVDPLPGMEMHLTLDAELQKVAEEYMAEEDKSGAVVAMEVKTGRVLTLVSTPSIHLEEFIGGISVANWNALRNNPKSPLLNKTIQGAYPPGSTYKMITALAGLTHGVIDKDTSLYCPGYYTFGNRTFRCWKHSGHGEVDLLRALGESCDVYFYQVGQWVGVDGLAKTAAQFGLGKKTGIKLEHEKSGITPTKKWKQQRFKKKWQEGETLSVAIGQGFNDMTPLQINVMTATLATRGKRMKPQLIEKIIDAEGNVVHTFEPELSEEITINPHHMELIHQGMFEVVQGKKGTARKVAIEGLNIAGKTGTAQVVKVAKYRGLKEEDIPYKYRDHAWFTCYAPAEDPEIAVTVLVEHGLHGGSQAGPIARAVLAKYFERQLALQAALKSIQQEQQQ